MAIKEKPPVMRLTQSELKTVGLYAVRRPLLAAHDAKVFGLGALEEKFLVPGKTEEVREDVKRVGIHHVGIITDKSGTWAETRGLPRRIGYEMGARMLTKTLVRAKESGITEFTE
jgi:hypothetical protein